MSIEPTELIPSNPEIHLFAAEIVSSIFDGIIDAGDCFSLALTSKRCWVIGQRRMKAIILEHTTVWAGDRIICVDDYTERGDLPEGLLSAEEDETIYEQPRDPNPYLDPLDSYCNKILPISGHDPRSLLLKLLADCDHISLQDRDRLISSISYSEPDVLRNISKRQYVRRAALLEMRETCPKWKFDQVDLGHIVVSRFCWPSIQSHHGGIDRNVWAGDRFDITSADALEDKDEHGQQIQWVDVTDEAIEEMLSIWSDHFWEGVLPIYGSPLHHR